MINYTQEEIDRWSRQMAGIEGWTDIRRYDDEERPCLCGKYNSLSNYGWNKDQDSPLVGKPPDEEESNWHLEIYHLDLNALFRVCRKIGETSNGIRLLDWEIGMYILGMHTPVDEDEDEYVPAWQACLTVEELFPIIGRITDKMIFDREMKIAERSVERLTKT